MSAFESSAWESTSPPPDDWSVQAARWLAKPDSYFVWGPLLTLIVTIIFLCNCWRDVKRLFFNNMPKTRSHHTAAVIWLHGTGDAGAGFAFLKKACERELRHIKWVLPDAPRTPLTAAQGAPRRAWVDVAAMPIKIERKPDDAALSRVALRRRQVRGRSRDRAASKLVHEVVELAVVLRLAAP